MIAQSKLATELYQRVTSRSFSSYQQASQAFVDCYTHFALAVQSGTGGKAVQIPAASAQLYQQVWQSYQRCHRQQMAAILSQALLQYWLMQSWLGGSGPGNTMNPGHPTTFNELYQFYGNGIQIGDAHYHAQKLAEILARGVKPIVTIEYPPLRPPDVTVVV